MLLLWAFLLLFTTERRPRPRGRPPAELNGKSWNIPHVSHQFQKMFCAMTCVALLVGIEVSPVTMHIVFAPGKQLFLLQSVTCKSTSQFHEKIIGLWCIRSFSTDEDKNTCSHSHYISLPCNFLNTITIFIIIPWMQNLKLLLAISWLTISWMTLRWSMIWNSRSNTIMIQPKMHFHR